MGSGVFVSGLVDEREITERTMKEEERTGTRDVYNVKLVLNHVILYSTDDIPSSALCKSYLPNVYSYILRLVSAAVVM
jgi:hypothetical protein